MNKFTFLILILSSIIACQNTTDSSKKAVDNTNSINYDSLKIEIEKMYDTDQGYREKVVEMIKNKEPLDFDLVMKMNEADSVNQVAIRKIIDEHGWLPKSKIGEKAASAIFLIIQHSDVEIMEKYFPLFQEMVLKDEANKADAAMMEDRILMYNKKKQIYGTQASMRETEAGPEYFIWPIENASEVNQRRKEAGFENTVEENAASMNAKYDPNEAFPVKE